jgi:heat shock protein HslJ
MFRCLPLLAIPALVACAPTAEPPAQGQGNPPNSLAGSNWSFVSIGGVGVAKDRPTSLQFDGARLSGSAGCNRFSGGYSASGETLTAGPLEATEMACPGAGMTQEAAFFKLMAAPVKLTFANDGTLILTGSEGKAVVLRRVI